ncbi:MarR family winged helix-turn-helix transcriptional regulator [Niallia taxi]|uniref:MarR family transcriptional regulator n=1 Tax=Niallia taxi TaxID=2499688 RepID=A0A437K5P7_9BACI|nr:MarR family transcriptional regulator [Niallia taxi]MCM3214131.1 MarR family transcriptional regulator [Niallia taxi]MCT2343481.1 MarR family transcriptional regulator [Niallia taxi]MDE5053186.1 MarR family transcriptional regulator [Niallia taxi]MED3963486.1 MarR family transcriptional regulator [Niallia taxi]MED4040906.1 MarR family transcriptional regulator [Niallia taxi]
MNDVHELFHSVQQLARQMTKALNDALQPFDIYSSQWTVLFLLKTKGSMTQKEISDYLAIEAPPITRTVQKLVANGYVRQVKGIDKRTKRIELTEKALEKYPEWEKAVLQMNQELIQPLTSASKEQLLLLISDWNQQLAIRGKEFE